MTGSDKEGPLLVFGDDNLIEGNTVTHRFDRALRPWGRHRLDNHPR